MKRTKQYAMRKAGQEVFPADKAAGVGQSFASVVRGAKSVDGHTHLLVSYSSQVRPHKGRRVLVCDWVLGGTCVVAGAKC